MISVEEALQHVLNTAQPRPPVRVSLHESLGCVLGEDVVSDVPMPSWNAWREVTVQSAPASSADHAVPSHEATLLAASPPACVKPPPA